MKHVVFYSGGIASYCVAKRVVASHGADSVVLLFTDTNYEHEDLYSFLHASAGKLGLEVTRIADGRTPWEVFRDVRFLGNSRIDPCSRILKRDLARKWVKDRFPDPSSVVLYLGLAADERHRLERSRRHWDPYKVESPIVDMAAFTKADMLMEVRLDGLEVPELYSMGFPHNNCGGFCVKAGQGHFRHLLRQMPEKYAECERNEEEMRALLGDVSILRETRNGETRRLTLRQLRERDRADCNLLDWGGCGCFGDANDETQPD